jgi:hypothetical protein
MLITKQHCELLGAHQSKEIYHNKITNNAWFVSKNFFHRR